MSSSDIELSRFNGPLPIDGDGGTISEGLHSRKNSSAHTSNPFPEPFLKDETLNNNIDNSVFDDEEEDFDYDQTTYKTDLLNKHLDHGVKKEEEEEDDSPSSSSPIIEVTKVSYKGEQLLIYPLSHKLRIVKFQLFALFIIFTTIGLNDQATGNLLPILEQEYGVTQVFVSNIFLLQTLGYMSSCAITEKLHLRYGQFGALMIGGLLVVIPSLILFSKVKWFIIYVLCYYPIGIGIGLIDSIVNLIFGSLLENKSELLAVVHGVYGCCSFLTPLIITKLGRNYWNYFFLCQLTFSGLGLLACFFAFKNETQLKYEYMMKQNRNNEEQSNSDENEDSNLDSSHSTWSLMRKYPIVPLYTIALFFHLGCEVGFGAWIFSYLLKYKNGSPKPMSYITSSFWFGLTLGRFAFGMVISKCFANEYQALRFFSKSTTLLCGLVVIFAAIHSTATVYFVSLATIIFTLGAFIGPIFPLSSVVAVELLDPNVKLKGISVAISIGSVGAASIPYCDGIIMKYLGFGVFPILVTISGIIFTSAIFLYPKYVKNKNHYFYP